jgi:peptidoglycan/LPS O-acetylase OafA/YrhL
MPATPIRPPALPALTGIRFVAALHVVLYHHASEALSAAPWWATAALAGGPTAVSLFYILSGAVLVYSCTGRTGQVAAPVRSFWYARFARIYPVYFLALLLGAPFFVSAVLETYGGADAVLAGLGLGLASLLLLQGWSAVTVFAWNIPGWSLSAEAFFYAVFPAAAPRLWSSSTGGLVVRASLFYFIALIPPLAATAAILSDGSLASVRFPGGPGGLPLATWVVRFCGFSPLARLPEFVIGICLGHWLRRQASHPHSAVTRWGAALEWTAMLGLCAAFFALASVPLAKPWLDSGVLAPLFVLLVVTLSAGTGPVARLLSTRPAQVLGDASYALYILQEPVLIWLRRVPGLRDVAPQVFVPVFVLVLIVVSIACQRLVAEPVRQWLVRPRLRSGAVNRAAAAV